MGSKQRGNNADHEANGNFAPGNSYAWQKGASGNPAGRPREYKITELIRQELQASGQSGEAVAAGLARVAIEKAQDGDFRFYNLIVERMEGRLSEHLQLTETADCSEEELREAARLILKGETDG